MTVTINGTTGVTAATFDGAVDSADLTGNVDAARITGALNASGSAPIYACRAWVNFSGTGTVAIRASGNVSSVTDLGVGNYRVNFTVALPDANYACQSSTAYVAGSGTASTTYVDPVNSAYANVYTGTSSGFVDSPTVTVSIFR